METYDSNRDRREQVHLSLGISLRWWNTDIRSVAGSADSIAEPLKGSSGLASTDFQKKSHPDFNHRVDFCCSGQSGQWFLNWVTPPMYLADQTQPGSLGLWGARYVVDARLRYTVPSRILLRNPLHLLRVLIWLHNVMSLSIACMLSCFIFIAQFSLHMILDCTC